MLRIELSNNRNECGYIDIHYEISKWKTTGTDLYF